MAMPRHESVFQNQQQYDVGKISHTHMDTCTFLNYSVKVCISQSVTVLLVKFFFFVLWCYYMNLVFKVALIPASSGSEFCAVTTFRKHGMLPDTVQWSIIIENTLCFLWSLIMCFLHLYNYVFVERSPCVCPLWTNRGAYNLDFISF